MYIFLERAVLLHKKTKLMQCDIICLNDTSSNKPYSYIVLLRRIWTRSKFDFKSANDRTVKATKYQYYKVPFKLL